MEKIDYINFVKSEYKNACQFRDKCLSKYEYLVEVNAKVEEINSAKLELDTANLNIEKLKTIMLLPFYEKISHMSVDTVMSYNQSRTDSLKKQLELNKSELRNLKEKENQLIALQEQLISSDDKKDDLISKGKQIQKSLTEIRVLMLNSEKSITEITNEIIMLKQRNYKEVKDNLIIELGLEEVSKLKDENFISDFDKLLFFLKEKNDFELVSAKFKEYDMLENKNVGKKVKCDENIGYLLSYTNLIQNSELSLSTFNDCILLDEAFHTVKSRLESKSQDVIAADTEIENVKSVLVALNSIKEDSTINTFIKVINEIVDKYPKLKHSLVSDLDSLEKNDNFMAKMFNSKRIEEIKLSIKEKIINFSISLLCSIINSLVSKFEYVNYSEPICNRSFYKINDTFEPLFMRYISSNIFDENMFDVLDEVKLHINKLNDKYETLSHDIDLFNKKVIPLKEVVKLEDKKRNKEMEVVYKEIEDIFGKRLEPYNEFNNLSTLFTQNSIEEIMSNLYRKKIMKDVSLDSPNYSISLNELIELRQDFNSELDIKKK